MNIVYADKNLIDLGYKGENNATKVLFKSPYNLSQLNMSVKLLYLPPNKSKATEYQVTQELDNTLSWTITDSITEDEGYGKVQLNFYDNETNLIKKTKVYNTVCKTALEKETQI